VYKEIRRRFRNLFDIKLPLKNLDTATVVSPRGGRIAKLSLLPTFPSELKDYPDAEDQDGHKRALAWISEVLASHARALKREHYMRMFRSAVEKEATRRPETWSEMERLYMTLSNPNMPNPKERLRAAVILVDELNLAEQLSDISTLATQRREAIQRASKLDKDAHDIRSRIVDRTQELKIDHFACAIPLATLKLRLDIVDDNEGCCPVCQNSYTDLSTNTVPDLLADFPVRIKHCGHVIGKACLEQWMSTPKIDEAKYPHRTCPLCRVKIEGIPGPPYPASLKRHVKTDLRAAETLKEFVYGWDIEMEECLDTIATCMSEEIACEELLVVIKNMAGKTRWGYEKDQKMIEDKMEGLKEERWIWGFRGNHIWRQMRDEWMHSGVVRKE
jgi:hypothetical protein